MATITSSVKSALDLFGSKTKLCENIFRAISEGRIKAGLLPDELGHLSYLDDPSAVSNAEQTPATFSGFTHSDVLSLLTQLGINIERLLPLTRNLSAEEVRYWDEKRREAKAQAVIAGTGDTELPSETTLLLYIRLQALEEIFSPSS